MLSDRDKAVVYSMCQAGMTLNSLVKSFPQFDSIDIETVYNEYKNTETVESEGISISCNCS